MKFFNNLKLAYKIMSFVMLALIFICFVGGVGYYFNNKAEKASADMYDNKLMPIYQLNVIRIYQRANEANLLKLIFDSNKENQKTYLDDLQKRGEETETLLKNYESTQLMPEEKTTLAEFKKYFEDYKPQKQHVIDLALAGKSTEAFDYFLAKKMVFDEMAEKMSKLSQINTEAAEKIKQQNAKDAEFATAMIVGTIIAALIIALSFGLILSNMISKPINRLMHILLEVAEGNLIVEKLNLKSNDEIGKLAEASDKMVDNLQNLVKNVIASVQTISADSEEVNAAADQTAQGANQVAVSVSQLTDGSTQISNSVLQLASGAQKISTSVVQLANGAKDISHNVNAGAKNINKMNGVIQKISQEANNIAVLTSNTEQNANEGSQHVKKAVNKIGSIKNVATDISCTINELGKLGSEIEQIVDLIKGIASQTNLLALNAAIEAARAGEHGKGFAVVAEEVKKLAGQSADATDKITTMIKDIQNKTGVAVNIMDKAVHEVDEGVVIISDAGAALENIIDKVKEANKNIQVVTREIDDVAKNSEEIVEMVDQISKITEKTTTNAEEIAAITEETAASAEEISSITEEAASNTEEISSVIEEQNASLEEITNSTRSLVQTIESLQEQVSVFKVEMNKAATLNARTQKAEKPEKKPLAALKLQPTY